MANKAAYLEIAAINTLLRGLSTAVSGSNASTTNILVASSAGFKLGDVVQLTTPGSLHRVTAVPDGTHVTVSPAAGSAPTTGNVLRVAYAPPGIWIGLFTVVPTDAGGGTEVTGGAYARVQVSQLDASWAAPSGTPSATSNSAAVTFPAPSGANWGVIVAVGFFDAATAGNLLGWELQTPNKTVNNGDPAPSIPIAGQTWSED